MTNHRPPRWRVLLRKLGRSAIFVCLAIIFFLTNIIVNLYSNYLEPKVEEGVGKDLYPQVLTIALVVCLVIAVVVYLYDKRTTNETIPQADAFDPDIEARNRATFIRDMILRVKERLEQAPKLIALHLVERADAVIPPGADLRPYDLVRRRHNQPDEQLSTRARIIDLYDEHNGQLLILGAPGAGKTFLLYELAQALVERAAQDATAPIPIVFSLAAWPAGKPLGEWLIDDLYRRYSAKRPIIARFIRSGAVLPLLDGLDEVATFEQRQQCVATINAYRQSQDLLPPLVVSCREREYQDLAPLHVNTALVVQPLTPVQINRYLAGNTYIPLRATLAASANLGDLARTPLLLNLLAVTYRDHVPTLFATKATDLEAAVLDDYITHCLALQSNASLSNMSALHLRAFLIWLAQSMVAHGNQQEFYIEFIQPDWLPKKSWRLIYYALSIMTVVLIGGLIEWLVIRLGVKPEVGLGSGIMVGLTVGMLEVTQGIIKPIEILIWSGRNSRSGFNSNLVFGLVGGLVFGLLGELLGGMMIGLVIGLIGGFEVVLMGWLAMMLMGLIIDTGIQRSLLNERKMFNQGIHRSIRSALLGGLVFGLVFGLMLGLGVGLMLGLSVGLMLGLEVGLEVGLGVGLVGGLVGGLLANGGAAVIQHYILRLLLSLTTPAPLQIGHWLEEARRRGLLVRVGGGYRFYHELLQRHFANQSPPDL